MKKKTTAEMRRMTVAEFHESAKTPLVVVLDNVRSQHNIGAVFRTADAFRLRKVILCGISACPPNQEIHKTALGAEESVEWEHSASTADAVRRLHEEGYTVFAVEQVHDSIPLPLLDLTHTGDRPVAVVMGHEVFGVSQEVVDMSDGCIEIPQYGTKHSLNVSVAAGIVLYSLSRLLRPSDE
ncbi:MAG: RNA methyltransferase [Paludibacteraceae bacterium]|nr:RNA methyltransferase [Paludibacteraceae bacterium]